MFYSYGENLAFELTNKKVKKLNCSKNFDKNEIKFVSYSNNLKPEIQEIHKRLNVKKYVRMKAHLNFVLLQQVNLMATLQNQVISEWDIAAGHAILQHAGGSVTDFNYNEVLYGKKDFKNPSIILRSKNIL